VAVAFVVFGCVPAIAALGLAAAVDAESYLHDTYFEVGRVHLMSAAIAFAALAGMHTFFTRRPNTFAAWVGGCVCSGGMLLLANTTFGLGARGMPRRYWDYDPEFQAGFETATFGVIVLVVGIVILIGAWIIGKPARAATA